MCFSEKKEGKKNRNKGTEYRLSAAWLSLSGVKNSETRTSDGASLLAVARL